MKEVTTTAGIIDHPLSAPDLDPTVVQNDCVAFKVCLKSLPERAIASEGASRVLYMYREACDGSSRSHFELRYGGSHVISLYPGESRSVTTGVALIGAIPNTIGMITVHPHLLTQGLDLQLPIQYLEYGDDSEVEVTVRNLNLDKRIKLRPGDVLAQYTLVGHYKLSPKHTD